MGMNKKVGNHNPWMKHILSFIEESDEIFSVKTVGYDILYLNKAGSVFMGVSPEEAEGKKCFSILGRTEPCEGCLAALATETKKPQSREVHIKEKNTWFMVKNFPLVDHEGRVVAVIETLRDCTERKKAIESLSLAVKTLNRKNSELAKEKARAEAMALKAEEGEKIKSSFLANMSHEIRTPLNGVLGMADLLLETPMTADQREYAETVKRSADHLLALMDDILDLSRLEVGKIPLESIPFNLREMLEDLAGEGAVRGAEKKLEVDFFMDPAIPALVKGDPVRVRQVLGNLLGNAVKFTPSGEVRLEAIPVEAGVAGLRVRFTISDTGVGVPDALCPFLFQPFSQGDPSTTRKFGGTGLGLSISKGLTEAMGGSIGMKGRDGGGSVFWCEIPFLRAFCSETEDLPVDQRLLAFPVILAGAPSVRIRAMEAMARQWLCSVHLVESAEELEALLLAPQEEGPSRRAVFVEGAGLREGKGWSPAELSERAGEGSRFFSVAPLGKNCGRGGSLSDEGYSGRITWPVRREAFRNALLSAAENPGSPAGGRWSKKPLNARILVAEDNKLNRKIAGKMLEKLGCSVEEAVDGDEALKLLAREEYDLVLMDVQMPGKDGLEVTKALRSPSWTGANKDVSVIALTAHAMAEDRARCLAAGMDDYLAKPVRLKDLEEKLHLHLNEKRDH